MRSGPARDTQTLMAPTVILGPNRATDWLTPKQSFIKSLLLHFMKSCFINVYTIATLASRRLVSCSCLPESESASRKAKANKETHWSLPEFIPHQLTQIMFSFNAAYPSRRFVYTAINDRRQHRSASRCCFWKRSKLRLGRLWHAHRGLRFL